MITPGPTGKGARINMKATIEAYISSLIIRETVFTFFYIEWIKVASFFDP